MLQIVHCTKLCDDIHICGHLNVFIILIFLEMTINVLGTNVPIFSSSRVVTNEEIFISVRPLSSLLHPGGFQDISYTLLP